MVTSKMERERERSEYTLDQSLTVESKQSVHRRVTEEMWINGKDDE